MRDRLRLGSRDRETRQIGAAARPFHLTTMGKTGALLDIAGTFGWPLHIEKLTTRRLFGRQRPMYTAPDSLPLQQGGGGNAAKRRQEHAGGGIGIPPPPRAEDAVRNSGRGHAGG